jgi:hypothetical protein
MTYFTVHQNFLPIKHLNLTSTNFLSGDELWTEVEIMGNVTLYRCFSNLPEPYKTFLRQTDELIENLLFVHIVTIQWLVDLLNTYTSKLQVITMLSLIRTLCFSLQHMLSVLCLHWSLPSNRSQQSHVLLMSLLSGNCLTTNSSVISQLLQLTHDSNWPTTVTTGLHWSSLYSLGSDPIENTNFNSPPIVACVNCCCSHMFTSCCIATDPCLMVSSRVYLL